MNQRPEFTYIGRKSCGCVWFCAVDDPQLADEIADSTRYAVRNGYEVTRLPSDEAILIIREHFHCSPCPHERGPEQLPMLLEVQS